MVDTFITIPASSDRTELPFPITLITVNKTMNSITFSSRIPTKVVPSLTDPGNSVSPQYIQVPVLASQARLCNIDLSPVINTVANLTVNISDTTDCKYSLKFL